MFVFVTFEPPTNLKATQRSLPPPQSGREVRRCCIMTQFPGANRLLYPSRRMQAPQSGKTAKRCMSKRTDRGKHCLPWAFAMERSDVGKSEVNAPRSSPQSRRLVTPFPGDYWAVYRRPHQRPSVAPLRGPLDRALGGMHGVPERWPGRSPSAMTRS